jgi:3-methyladenine DNA glycosylase AlkD
MITDAVMRALEPHAAPNDVVFLSSFFKTGEGQYGAGDVFIGVRVPAVRQVAKQFKDISLTDIEALLESPVHEMRLLAVIIMTMQYRRSDEPQRQVLCDLYLRRTDRINNWDIVDASCRDIVGEYVLQHPGKADILRKLATSADIWERRIAIVSTWQLIRAKRLDLTFEIAEMLLSDKHDLIHKAVGWMLREAGKRDETQLRSFLVKHKSAMPRTALRYAIERFSPKDRAVFMARD